MTPYINWVCSSNGINWGCSSNGRAPASHAGGKGIDAPLLHHFFANAIHDARVGQRVTLHSEGSFFFGESKF